MTTKEIIEFGYLIKNNKIYIEHNKFSYIYQFVKIFNKECLKCKYFSICDIMLNFMEEIIEKQEKCKKYYIEIVNAKNSMSNVAITEGETDIIEFRKRN